MGPFHIGEPPQFISMAVHIRCVGAAAQHSVNDGSYLCPGDRIYGRNVPSKNPPIQPYWAALVTWVQNQSSSFVGEEAGSTGRLVGKPYGDHCELGLGDIPIGLKCAVGVALYDAQG